MHKEPLENKFKALNSVYLLPEDIFSSRYSLDFCMLETLTERAYCDAGLAAQVS
jgi:hypothetical protein